MGFVGKAGFRAYCVWAWPVLCHPCAGGSLTSHSPSGVRPLTEEMSPEPLQVGHESQ